MFTNSFSDGFLYLVVLHRGHPSSSISLEFPKQTSNLCFSSQFTDWPTKSVDAPFLLEFSTLTVTNKCFLYPSKYLINAIRAQNTAGESNKKRQTPLDRIKIGKSVVPSNFCKTKEIGGKYSLKSVTIESPRLQEER